MHNPISKPAMVLRGVLVLAGLLVLFQAAGAAGLTSTSTYLKGSRLAFLDCG